MISPIDQQLVLEMLRGVKVFAWWFFTITPALNAVVAGGDSSVLHLDVSRRMRELAFGVRASTLVPLELAAHFELQPA